MIKDDNYWVNVAYVCLFLIGFYVGYQLIQSVGIATGWIEKYQQWYPITTTLGGAFLSALGVWLYVRQPGKKDHHVNVVAELRKVTWPGVNDTKRLTWVVVVVVAIFAVILGVFDLGWSWLLKKIIML
ncbi:MAG: preprotein translocase subunit SecE [Proteobacteria bacterium]|nr:preprotein translocase subunit SecE [Pseudomonadota bacterium]